MIVFLLMPIGTPLRSAGFVMFDFGLARMRKSGASGNGRREV